jgi:hypothetical protein
LIEDWRNYTEKLRSQHEGERAHIQADRKRMEEVMAEERQLWDQERTILKARIAELEKALESRGRAAVMGKGSRDTSMNRIPPGMAPRQSIQQQQALSFTSPGSNAVSVTGSVESFSSRGMVPQESGRNADGSPFYAPAPRNPSRTFSSGSIPSDTLRVDSISAPRESAIRVTSKELTSSDFGPQSPPTHAAHRESALDTIPEAESSAIPESIDISLIQPELEGVSIKASAVSPTFAAKVLSPQYSPAKLSPNVKPPGRDVNNLSLLSRSDSQRDSEGRENGKGKVDLNVVMHAPVDRRLTMHAGHTPNHSISKFDFGESGSATPTQETSDSQTDSNTSHNYDHGHIHRPSVAHFDGNDEDVGYDDVEDADRELIGQLGLTNEKHKDDVFLAQLTEKLAEEAKKSESVSPSSMASDSSVGRANRRRLDEEGEGKENQADDVPPLRLKPSSNFGRPFGSM